jgi:hypothetical protein
MGSFQHRKNSWAYGRIHRLPDCGGTLEPQPIVRVGVNELSFINSSACKDIYGHFYAEPRKYFPTNAVHPNQIIAAN